MRARVLAAPVLATLLALAACAQPSNTATLQSRADLRLTQAEPCNRMATIEYLPDGVRFQVPQAALFVPGSTNLNDCGRYTLSSMMEAMLDPALIQVIIEPDPEYLTAGYILPQQRAETVRAFFTDAGFTRRQPPVLVQPATTQSTGALWITMSTATS
jgi:hypothetical protein